MTDFTPFTEGEKVPDGQTSIIFRAPPGAPKTFFRSALVVGARGVGKTTLLRYQKEQHRGTALYIGLSTVFSPIGRKFGLGPLAYEIPAELSSAIPGMATSLLALDIADRIIRKNSFNQEVIDTLTECLPVAFRGNFHPIDLEVISRTKSIVFNSEPEHFHGIAESRPLTSFVSTLGGMLQQAGRPLLLLLDKADQVSPVSLIPVIELLDQSIQFLALVALRPGLTSRVIEDLSKVVVPGDHYEIVHLGRHPRAAEWEQFVVGAVGAQLQYHGLDKSSLTSLDPAIVKWIILLSRDSIRTALELFASALAGDYTALLKSAADQRESLLMASRASAHRLFDIKAIAKDVRSALLNSEAKTLEIPTNLSITKSSNDQLFERTTTLNRFIEENMRCAAFSLPDGQRWRPGVHPLEIEIAPLLLWQEADGVNISERPEPFVVNRTEAELKQLGGGGSFRIPTIFVAYNFTWDVSKKFRVAIENQAKNYTSLESFLFTDGHLIVGTTDWPSKIRDRIRSAKAIVGDVTNLRPDVIFEIGFAYGLRKPILAVAETQEQLGQLPNWLTASQMGHYNTPVGMRSILSSLSTHVADPSYANTNSKPNAPIPTLAVWLSSKIWADERKRQLSFSLTKSGLSFEEINGPTFDDRDADRASRAGLIVASLDNTESDAFVHYVCGAVIAKPSVARTRPFQRMIVLLVAPGLDPNDVIAQSLLRCGDIVKIIPHNDLSTSTKAINDYCARFAKFSASKKTRKK